MKFIKKIILLVTLGFLTCSIAFGVYFLAVTHGINLDKQKLLMPETQVYAYDKNGNLLSGASSFDHRVIVDISELPDYLPAAFVNTEDKRFFQHNGFDIIGILRATIKNARSNSFKQGASTISQQLIKNTHLTLDKTISRKLKELKLTRQLEKNYSKDEILATYLNTIYFGHNCYGIESASRFYFNKQASELNVAESALLAGLVKAPNHYSPFKNVEKAYARRKTVLLLMKEQGTIDESTYKNALNSPLPTTFYQNSNKSYLHFALQELDEIIEANHLNPHGKIEIFTHYSPEAQAIIHEQINAFESDKIIAIINNETLGIEGYYASIPQTKRSPGSLIKPLLIYAPAFEEGTLSPASPILDEPTDFNGYSPQNYQNEYFGYVSVRDAIAKSLNIPAVKTLNSLSFEKVSSYADKMRLSIPDNDKTLAYALGGMERGYEFSKILDGYTCLANAGIYSPSSFIKEIKQNGVSVYTAPQQKSHVYSPETAYLVTDVLKSTVEKGTAKKLRNLPFYVAAKTGTASRQGKNTDAYAVTFTSEHTIGVWLGNANMSEIATTGGGVPCEICRSILEKLYATNPPDDIQKPIGVEELSIDRYYYEQQQRLLLADKFAPISYQKRELFASRFAPKEHSTLFTKPCIATPRVALVEEGVLLSFSQGAPDGYGYKIIRSVNGREEIVYSGKAIPAFLDKQVKPNAVYEYSVIPYFQKNEGKPIDLPSIYSGDFTPPIVNKPWWNG